MLWSRETTLTIANVNNKYIMSSLSTFSSKSNAKPPLKGSFPLDHDGECKDFMIKYMRCLRINKKEITKCREESKDYLNCRMEKNLMLKEDWSKLGFSDLKDGDEKAKNGSS